MGEHTETKDTGRGENLTPRHDAHPEFMDDTGTIWTEYQYGPDDVIYQRECPHCDRGLLLAPARFCVICGGDGFLVGTPHFGRSGAGSPGVTDG